MDGRGGDGYLERPIDDHCVELIRKAISALEQPLAEADMAKSQEIHSFKLTERPIVNHSMVTLEMAFFIDAEAEVA